MKTMKKVLLALLVVVLLCSAMLISVFAAEDGWGDTATADEYLGAVQAAEFAEKKALLDAYDEYMSTHRFPDNRLGQINMTLHLARASEVKREVTLASIDVMKNDPTFEMIKIDGELTEKDWTKNIAYYNSVLVGYESRYYFDTTLQEYKDFAETLIPMVEAVRAELQKRIDKYYTAPLDEYDLQVTSRNGFEPDVNGNISKLSSVQFTAEGNFVEYPDNFGAAGSSHSFRQHINSTTGDPYSNINFRPDATHGVVLEFDLYYQGGSLNMHCGSAGMGGGYHSGLGVISGDYIQSGYGGDGSVQPENFPNSDGLLVTNAWNRVALSFSQQTKEFSIYINFIKVGSYKWSLLTTSYAPQVARLKQSGGSDMYYDNILIYYGSSPRVVDQFDEMDDVEKLTYYVDMMKRDVFDFANRELAYEWLKENIGTYYNTETGTYTALIASNEAAQAKVQEYLAFDFVPYKVMHHVELINGESIGVVEKLHLFKDVTGTIEKAEYFDESKNILFAREENPGLYDALEAYKTIDTAALEDQFQLENLAGLVEIYDRLMALDHNDFETIAQREQIHTEIDLYYLAVGAENISTKDPASEINENVAISLEKIEHDKVVRTISNYLTYFDRAANYTTRTRWIRRIETEKFYNDVSVFDNLENEIHLVDMKAKYESILEAMVGYTNENNSKKVVQSVEIMRAYAFDVISKTSETPLVLAQITGDFVLEYVKAEYAAYEQDNSLGKPTWDYIRKYILVARAAMEEGYLPGYTGLRNALNFYQPLFEYFYDLVQLEHIAQINSALSRYESAQTFIDKKGICVYVENYLIENDIDFTREDIQAIQERVEAIRLEVEEQETEEGIEPSVAEKEYLAFLEENAGKFIAAVEVMSQASTYVALEGAFRNAQQYYYFIAITDAETQAAVDEYMRLEGNLRAWQINSELFIGYVNALPAATTLDATYTTLVNAYAVKELAEASYPGMAEALSTYEDAYKSYTDAVNKVNTEVEETVEVMTANTSPYTVIQAIINFFKKLFG